MFDCSKLHFFYDTDKDAISYKLNEPMVFIFYLKYDGDCRELPKFFLRWSRTGDDGICSAGMSPIAPDKDVKLVTSINRPGFVRFIADVVTGYDGATVVEEMPDGMRLPMTFDGGAGADTDKILPAAEEPTDFCEFWKRQCEILNEVPVKATMTRVSEDRFPKSQRGIYEAYAVSVDCAGPRPVTGYFIRRADTMAKSMPARVAFHGYGVGNYSDYRFTDEELHIADSAIYFNVNAHGYDLDRKSSYYEEMNKKLDGYGLKVDENENPETAYFRNMAFRVIRAFDFMKSRPEWNGKDLIAAGGSQGGLQSIWAASLVPELTQCFPTVPWCSDINGVSAARLPGWLPRYCRGLGYFDTVFHSRHIPATCTMFVDRYGLGDYVCPPSGTMAQFNAANCPKSAYWVQNSQHGTMPPIGRVHKFFRQYPAGHGITGTEPTFMKESRPTVDFVPAKMNWETWKMFRDDGSQVFDFHLHGEKTDFRKGRAVDGGDIPVEGVVRLQGTFQAEQDGYALLGVGLDWWWNVFVNDKPIFGRTRSTGANDYDTFEKTDWAFRVPVKKGVNTMDIDLTLGSYGTGNFDFLDFSFANKEISKDEAEQYERLQADYPVPSATPEIKQVGDKLLFKSAQPYPACVEYGDSPEKLSTMVCDYQFSCEHQALLLDLIPGKRYYFRVVQNAFLSGWCIKKSDIMELVWK